ncbi:ABC transporter substrate-binding protein (plasmid) [Rhizobium lusitanum]|uniref:ABC transporter substrate-binding protein n=1 Tax=Rhizobium lusitanum TaxID=293958 RepID=UPI00160A54B9|nr:ABC transporter substrate-binding protein [Rhizobium lusitanum]QND45054.1 ABC transporter substrate-binding protein [Rhizobium lusitanum]
MPGEKTISNILQPTRRRFLQTAGALSATLSAGGLLLPGSAAAQAETPVRGGHLVLGLDTASSSDRLDPAFYTEAYMYTVGFQLFNTVVELGPDGKLIGALAESWEPATPDGSKWVFKLKKGIQFHNGKELTAQDVVYSLNHHRGEKSNSGGKGQLLSVTDISASDTHEVTVTLNSGNADFPAALVDYHLGIGPDGGDFDKGVGTGAFILEDFQPGVRALTKRNPNYWASDRAFVDSVETIAMSDATARMAALLSGQVHIINRVEPRAVSRLTARPGVQILRSQENTMYCFPMRVDTAPYNNLDLRLALKYAIDREELQKSLLVGTGAIGNDNPIASWNPYFAKDIPQRAYDPEKAAFHFKKAGSPSGIQISASDNGFPGSVDAAQLYQASAAKAGITIDVDRVPSDGYWDEVWLKKPFVASNWSVRPTADAMLSLILQSDAPWNETAWRDESFDKLLAAARVELDETKRKQIYHDLQLKLVNEGGEIIPLFVDNLAAASDKVGGYVPVPGGGDLSGYRIAERAWLKA